MNLEAIHRLIEATAKGELTADDAKRALEKSLAAPPHLSVGSAKIDIARKRRRGLPEVIYCEGKRPEQVADIFAALAAADETALGTRAREDHYQAIAQRLPDATFDPVGRIVLWEPNPPPPAPPFFDRAPIAVVSAGLADEPVAREAVGTLEAFGHRVTEHADVGVAGIDRLFEQLDVVKKAAVVIVVAGWDAALPSVVAGLIDAPVIAVPTSAGYGASFGGLSALLASLNSCAGGVTVVNIDNGFGAACAASLIVRKVMAYAAATDST